MNSSSHARSEEQAALWAARIDGDSLSSADHEELDRWLAKDPAHRALLSQYCQLSSDLEEQLPALVLSGAVAMSEPKRRRGSSWRPAWLAIAAAVVVAILLGTTVWVREPDVQTLTASTSLAQRRTLTLADGSLVELNARTSVLVDLGRQERRVRMAEGEAYFTVAKDKTRPFIVETPAGAVRVTGTVFDVHADRPDTLTVTVTEGSVQVTPHQPPGVTPAAYALSAGDQLLMDNGDPVAVKRLGESELDDALAWRRGEAVFVGTRLDQALARFGRYHGRTVLASPEVGALRVGGRFGLDDLDGFLNALEAFLPVQVSRESSGVIRVAPRTGG